MNFIHIQYIGELIGHTYKELFARIWNFGVQSAKSELPWVGHVTPYTKSCVLRGKVQQN